MKKNILLLLMCCITMAANAQFYVGGTLGVGCVTTKVKGESSTAATYSIAPEFGYKFNKWIALGATLGATYTEPGDVGDDITLFELSPYLRTTFVRLKAIDFFVDAAFSYQHAKNHGTDLSVDGWGLGINPGFSVNVSDRWKLLGRTTIFQYSSSGDELKVKTTGFALANNFTVGVLYQF